MKLFGFRLYRHTTKRLAKKYLKDTLIWKSSKRLSTLDVTPGALISTCQGLNSRILSLEPEYYEFQEFLGYRSIKGVFLHDVIIVTDKTTCSAINCGISKPLTYEESIAYQEQTIKAWEKDDEWGFAEKYKRITILPDTTFIESPEP